MSKFPNKPDQNPPPEGTRPHDEQEFVRLIKNADAANKPSKARYDRVYASVHSAWLDHTKKARKANIQTQYYMVVWSAAACFALFGLSIFWLSNLITPETPRLQAGTIAKVNGEVHLLDGSKSIIVKKGKMIFTHLPLTTYSDSGVAIQLGNGQSIRLDQNTQLQFLAKDTIKIEQGAVYFDSGVVSDQNHINIITPYGVVRDIGTQFEVRLSRTNMTISVREGEVSLDGDTLKRRQIISAQEKLTLTDNGTIRLSQIAPDSIEWNWTQVLAEPFDFDGYSLNHFLVQFTRENGWKLRYTSPAAERHALSTLLHGSILGLNNQEVLEILPHIGKIKFDLNNLELNISIDTRGEAVQN